jgi:hypothetical protein
MLKDAGLKVQVSGDASRLPLMEASGACRREGRSQIFSTNVSAALLVLC